VTVAVFGFGSMGRRHAMNARGLGHTVAVCETDAEQRAAAGLCGFIVFSLEIQVWAWNPDVVIIATPAASHLRLHTAASYYGIQALVEKPLYAELSNERPVNEWDRVGYNLRFHDGLRLLRDAIAKGDVPESASLVLRCDKASWPGRGYMSMLFEGSHEIDLALWLFGRPATLVSAREQSDAWVLVIDHDRGTRSTIEITGAYAGYDRRVMARVSGSTLQHAMTHTGAWTLFDGHREASGAGSSFSEMYRREMADFLSNGPHGCTLDEAYEVTGIAVAARDIAWRSNQLVRRPASCNIITES